MIDYDKLGKALGHLKAQYDNYLTLDSRQPQLIQEAVAESVIQRFETCYDCLWKTLRRHLVEEQGLHDVPTAPKPLARLAHENNLLPTGIAPWMAYIEARIGTAHDYSGEKAQVALQLLDAFIRDAAGLYATMRGEGGQ